ncbi:D-alanine--D-alanine ligase [Candidatus Odyssella acanthamoebae]|uniref:D-alanine--D-alanine ligase n=1 Tax=Candidatus Odyssella acanthamoebae TaxID=91604 RepID=A0A077AXF9_9PROT|nr:D-alanine--D-alanine ligase [Candidatus Paracaedibacter acanthamoebae]AIK96674.1 D-alanine--D-alanine ligase [Candidatus Paracaedibacter acanthamoebae]
MSKKNVAVLMGGWSNEREVSLMSGVDVAQALRTNGHTVREIDVTRDITKLANDLLPLPDVAFVALHGTGGEDGVIQGILETMAIPYTHSGVTASAVGMDKVLSRKLFQHIGLQTPPSKVVTVASLKQGHPMAVPYVIKPIAEGSSRGVYIVRDLSGTPPVDPNWPDSKKVLIEEFIDGREIQVGVMGDRALGAIEICPIAGFYDYEAKYTDGKAVHKMPAPISESAYQRALDIGLQAHQLLDCTGVSRSDLMYDETKDCFYLLEINTHPGMTPLSLLPEIAAHAGISYNDLVEWMLRNAQCHQ